MATETKDHVVLTSVALWSSFAHSVIRRWSFSSASSSLSSRSSLSDAEGVSFRSWRRCRKASLPSPALTSSTWWSSSAHSRMSFLLSSRLRSMRLPELWGCWSLGPGSEPPPPPCVHTTTQPHTRSDDGQRGGHRDKCQRGMRFPCTLARWLPARPGAELWIWTSSSGSVQRTAPTELLWVPLSPSRSTGTRTPIRELLL
ncbi:hypothetical protein EYF80_021890 [Liparis tanakae]|uniref:Uncharacterized protein n=1 Tax=Liparis tanakae TaxID=230148 RepID=A0A4Z2HQR6_9TELE|nr:hypothetical protein EYF80_021890 [Liparis tanakae]